MVQLATLYTAIVACVIAVQGSVLVPKADCPVPDRPKITCQTTGGSPSAGDCNEAINRLTGQCIQRNSQTFGSYCTTLVKVGNCKIDVCGFPNAQLDEGSNGRTYLRQLHDSCQSGGRVGGYTVPSPCYVDWSHVPEAYPHNNYHLQFSHT